MTESGTLRLDRAECKGKDVVLSAVVLVRICRHATCDVAIFFYNLLNRPARIAVSLLSKNYQSRWNLYGNVNTIEMLWSVNLQRCIVIILSGNCCFLSLMTRYCPQQNKMHDMNNDVMRNDK